VPEFLGDEGEAGMEETQGVGEDEVENREGVGAAWGVGSGCVLLVACSADD
jgi:hypothetical protein